METSKKIIEVEELRKKVEQNFINGDRVDQIESVIQELIAGKLRVSYKDLS